jgi:predicted dehydrogenase
MDLGIHDIDFARWCFGDVERVYARGLTFAATEPNDHALIVLRFSNGAIGHIESSWAYPPGGFRTGFEIAGDQGIVEFDSLAPAPLTVIRKPAELVETACMPEAYNPLAPWDDPYYLELDHFLKCLDTGQDFLVSPEDALQAVKVALASLESMQTGQSVALATFAATA